MAFCFKQVWYQSRVLRQQGNFLFCFIRHKIAWTQTCNSKMEHRHIKHTQHALESNLCVSEKTATICHKLNRSVSCHERDTNHVLINYFQQTRNATRQTRLYEHKSKCLKTLERSHLNQLPASFYRNYEWMLHCRKSLSCSIRTYRVLMWIFYMPFRK